MQIYISYYYQIRFFTPNMIPVSTAKWDPKWYYNGKQGKAYKDKNGVYNGIRADVLVFPASIWGELAYLDAQCEKGCHQQIPCLFMQKYRQYLDTLDFANILHRCQNMANKIQSIEGFTEEPIIVLIVHEPLDCQCAERPVLQQWFHDNGYELLEWNPNTKSENLHSQITFFDNKEL